MATAMYVEDHPDWRRDLTKLVSPRLGGHIWIPTEDVAQAKEALNQGQVQVLVLDLGLNVGWSNIHMPRVLGQIAKGQELSAKDKEDFKAYQLAELASKKTPRVYCALLTSFADPEDLAQADGLTLAQLREKFHAEEVFLKTPLSKCADWVCKKLREL